MGALRRRRSPVSARALRAPVVASRTADRHDAGGGRPARGRPRRHLPGLLDRRQLLHLDRASRRPAGVEPARGSAPGAGDAQRRCGCRRAGPRGGPHRRRQRLVLVVRRRSLVGARPGVRRPVQAAPPKRVSAARQADSRRALRQQHLGRGAGAGRKCSRRACCRPFSTGRKQPTSSGWAPGCSRSVRRPARCTRPIDGRRS